MNLCEADWSVIKGELWYLRFFHEAIRDYLGPADGDCVAQVQADYIKQGGRYVPTKWQEGD